ncbi:hypothetical protein [Leptolinea tardivitalis]|uniref:Uncharacterized protein n=1 Tax=Leptolinea tardivitalis TaxID=229920 RepID=A0A0N8GL95_9CHLR|nr:hypothetical protein [Leptolinea tardivitalis]KPL71874.1 hypothetical protein ADM99_10730 [Leptolinea tardivitalis]GAP20279.1 hypothetical protein LTAR_00467 [Leptolinea tardivitalis]
MPDSYKKVCSCGSPLNYDLFTDNYICPVCNKKYILEVNGNLKQIANSGYIQSDPSFGRGESTQTRDFMECPICGKQNFRENTFRCSACGKAGICLNHQDGSSYLCINCSREKQQAYLFQMEQTRNYLQELKNISKKERLKFFKLVNEYAGKTHLKEIQSKLFKKNFLLSLISLGCLLFALLSLFKGEFFICGLSSILYVILSVISISCYYSTLSDAIDNEINRVKEIIAGNSYQIQNGAPTAVNSWASPAQFENVNSARLQQDWSIFRPNKVNAVEPPKRKSGGCATAFLYLLLFVGIIFAVSYWAGLILPGGNNSNNEPVNFSGIFNNGCKVWQDRYIIETCTVQEGGGNTKAGYRWCLCKERSNGAYLHRWVPVNCAK